ncbi:POC1 centriolar protein homolog A-like [Artemia franciscana]|uniref:Uncharacterized protein n=1 Tax=Artemia franciscana TaxID=6661 RepID=A0AA88KZU0_ARTSF|nr:hypothetical protein QYM36_009495 [Artemia franciscana]
MSVLFDEPALERELRGGHKGCISSLCFSPNGKQLASGGTDCFLSIWPLSKKMTAYRMHGHTKPITDLSYNPTGSLVATSSLDSSVRFWVPTVNGRCTILKPHLRGVRSVKFSPHGDTFATASDDKMIKLWDSKDQRFIRNFKQHRNWVRRVRYSNAGNQVVSCSDDKTTILWDIRKAGGPVHCFYEGRGTPTSVQFHPVYDIIAVGLTGGSVKLFDTRMFKLLQFYEIFNGDVSDITFDPNGSYIIAGSKNDTKVLDILEGRAIYNIGGHAGGVSSVSISSDGKQFVTGGMDGIMLLWKSNLTYVPLTETPSKSRRRIRPSIASQDDALEVKVTPKHIEHSEVEETLDMSHPEEELEIQIDQSEDAESDEVESKNFGGTEIANLFNQNELQAKQILALEAKTEILQARLDRMEKQLKKFEDAANEKI